MAKPLTLMILGDPHGRLPLRLREKLNRGHIDGILCTGDFGTISDSYRRIQLEHGQEIHALLNNGITWDCAVREVAEKVLGMSLEPMFNPHLEVIAELSATPVPCVAVYGNVDDRDSIRNLSPRTVVFLDTSTFCLEDITVVGISDPGPSDSFSKEVASRLRQLLEPLEPRKTILLSHVPPYGILDEVRDNHTGSRLLRDILDSFDFALAVFGHIHEARGLRQVRDTLCVNPGAAGQYVLARLSNERMCVQIRQVRGRMGRREVLKGAGK